MGKYCSGYIKPVHGETLSSWLDRGANIHHDARLSSAYWIHRGAHLAEKDFNVEHSLISAVSEALGLDLALLTSTFRAPSCWLIDNPKARLYFCAACLREKYISTGKIVVMGCWSNCWYTICDQHNHALEGRVSPDVAKEQALLFGITHAEHCRQIYFGIHTDFLKGQAGFHYGALKFQHWCGRCLSDNRLYTKSMAIPVNDVELKRFLMDVLVIIMRKRFWERDVKTYLSVLLQRSSWNSLNCSYYGSTFEDLIVPEFCAHTIRARILAFALMAFILDLPGGRTAWRMVPSHLKIADYSLPNWESKEAVWSYILDSELFDFRGWLKMRSLDWHALLREHYSYLI
jgi:hypothetical protein